jgi:DNA-binding PadR family transcriptional regulator
MNPLNRLYEHNTKGNLWIYILSLLSKEKMHAWNIQTVIEKKFGFKPGRITAYRVLYRLEEEKLVESENQDRRRIYKVTEKGLEHLASAKKLYKDIVKKLG